MTPQRIPLPFLLAACLAAALAAFGASGAAAGKGKTAPAGGRSNEPRSRIVYPAQRVAIRFDHRRHVAKGGASCVFCHTAAASSRSSADRLLPPPERCDACHGTDHGGLAAGSPVTAGTGPAAACAFCHEGHGPSDGDRVERTVMPPARLVFDHAAHYVRGIGCATCHEGVEKRGEATRNDLPTMKTCVGCHREDGAPSAGPHAASGDCDVCHVTREGARLLTRFPEGPLLPPRWLHDAEHGPDFIERHKRIAGADSAFCSNCHEEKECTDCHDGRVRPRRIHPSDWIELHAVSARQDGPSCTSCHREQSFCITCHERAGVTLSGPTGAQAERGRFHPPKAQWSDLPRTARHHSYEAERNISACVSCHTERDCALCHATAGRGGLGGLSPHPPGFASTCAAAMAKNPRPCRYCHDTSDPGLARCR